LASGGIYRRPPPLEPPLLDVLMLLLPRLLDRDVFDPLP
jgi:hypothetical protein